MKAPHTEFGKTRLVEVEVYINGRKVNSDTWDCVLWVETGEDWYAFGSSEFKNKKVRVVTRENWLSSK